jgi:deoxyribodipyrimidine photo-lyase
MIQPERIKHLNSKKLRPGSYVLYWMQASQSSEYNHALEYSVILANELEKPIVVFFGLTDDFPQANERHYWFMLEGLKEVQSSLEQRGIKMVIWHESPHIGVLELSKKACSVIVDRGYLRIQKDWRNFASANMQCPLIQVESDVVIPVEETSPKEEYSAATIRPKIKKKLDRYLMEIKKQNPVIKSLDMRLDSLDLENLEEIISTLKIDRTVRKVDSLRGGTSEAKKHLKNFLSNKLTHFQDFRNDPTLAYSSNMSPYLHFGQISPLYIALRALKTKSPGTEAFLEELVVRRELGMNFVFYNQHYDSFDALPDWAKTSLRKHKRDRREYLYTLEELENAKTHDPYWNAAQKEMRITGKMHGYMRMYWGKKIIEWTKTPEEAFEIALYLNNKYELDGRDPNGFAGVVWCFGKHDRPWREREIFGKIRYMNASGLKRKFDIDLYARKMARLK